MYVKDEVVQGQNNLLNMAHKDWSTNPNDSEIREVLKINCKNKKLK